MNTYCVIKLTIITVMLGIQHEKVVHMFLRQGFYLDLVIKDYYRTTI